MTRDDVGIGVALVVIMLAIAWMVLPAFGQVGRADCAARGATVELPTRNTDGSALGDLAAVQVFVTEPGAPIGGTPARTFPTPAAPTPGTRTAPWDCAEVPAGTERDSVWHAVDRAGNRSPGYRQRVDGLEPAAPSGLLIPATPGQ